MVVAAPLVHVWADQVAYFALGTNDLAASALGLDRDDPDAVFDADPLHPGMIHLIHDVVSQARTARRPIAVCGEMAADPLGTVALAVLGVDSLSVPVQRLAATRATLSGQNPTELANLRTELLRQRTATAVRELLKRSAKLE